MSQTKEINHISAALGSLGLSENEALLYTTMLGHPKSTVRELQQKTPFTRTMLYYVLNNLIRYGLVSTVEQKWRTVYAALDPEKLYDLLDQKQREFEQKKTDVRSIIPELRQTYRLSASRPNIRIFEGVEQYQTALEDIFTSKASAVYMYSPSTYNQNPGVEVRKEFENKRRKKNIKLYALTDSLQAAEQLAKSTPADAFRQIALLPENAKLPIVELRLYNGKLLYTRFEKHEPIATLIEDTLLYEMQKNVFLALWQKAERLKK